MFKNKLVVALIVVLVIVGTVVGVELSSEAWFCNTCHSMKSEHESWEQSVHEENGVECKHCHYGPGLMGIVKAKIGGMFQMVSEITGSMTKHSPETVAEHAGRLLLPQNIHVSPSGKEYGIMAVGEALENVNYRCRKCHANLVAGERDQSKEFPSKVTINHQNHLKREVNGKEVECTNCHQEIVHGEEPQRRNLPRMILCFECHDGETAFREDCFTCHTTQKNMHMGVTGIGIDEEMPGFMSEEDCTSCHLEEKEYRFSESACVECHDEEYVETLKEWQADTLAELRKTKEAYEAVSAMLEHAGKMGKSLKEPKKLLHDAMYNIRFVDKDGTGGAHNIDYATELLKVAQDRIASAKEMVQ